MNAAVLVARESNRWYGISSLAALITGEVCRRISQEQTQRLVHTFNWVAVLLGPYN